MLLVDNPQPLHGPGRAHRDVLDLEAPLDLVAPATVAADVDPWTAGLAEGRSLSIPVDAWPQPLAGSCGEIKRELIAERPAAYVDGQVPRVAADPDPCVAVVKEPGLAATDVVA